MICTGSSNCWQNRAAKWGCRADHRVHRIAQPVRVEPAGEVKSSCTAYISSSSPLRRAGVEEQPLLQGCQRQHVGDPILPLQLVDLLLAQPGRRDVGRRQPAPTAAHMRAHAGQGLKPQPAQPADLPWSSAEGAQVQSACSCGPVSASTVPALSSTVCASGMGIAAAAPVNDKPSWQIRHSHRRPRPPGPSRPR